MGGLRVQVLCGVKPYQSCKESFSHSGADYMRDNPVLRSLKTSNQNSPYKAFSSEALSLTTS